MATRQSKKKALHAYRLRHMAMVRHVANGLRKMVDNYPGQHPLCNIVTAPLSAKHVMGATEPYRYNDASETAVVGSAPCSEDGVMEGGGFRRGDFSVIGAHTPRVRSVVLGNGEIAGKEIHVNLEQTKGDQR